MKAWIPGLVSVFIMLNFLSCGGGGTTAAVRKNNTVFSGNEPSWVMKPKQDSKNFTVVGYAEDVGTAVEVREKALQNAKGKIANAIFEETEVEKIFTTSGGLGENEELRKNYRENVKSISAVKLSGIDIEDQFVQSSSDGGLDVQKVWLLVKISNRDLEKERNRIISELQRKLALVDNNLRQAEKYVTSGKPFDAVSSYVAAAISSVKVKERTDEFPIYMQEAGKVLSGIMIEPEDNPGSVDITAVAKFSFLLTSVKDDGKSPVSGVKVQFVIRNNSGSFTKNAVSDKNGMVTCAIKGLKETTSDNILTASLNLDFQEILDAGDAYKKYYSTLKDISGKIFATAQFKSVSAEKRNIPTTVIAILNSDGNLSKIPNLASEAQSALLSRGYKVVKFNDNISLEAVSDARQEALAILAAKGIRRVFVMVVISDNKPEYNESLERFMGVYSLSSQLIDTSTGEILSSRNIKISATSQSKTGVFNAFVKAAGRQIKKLID